MLKASAELGFGKTGKKAMEKVKFVPAGNSLKQ